jgi:hypothetical protein
MTMHDDPMTAANELAYQMLYEGNRKGAIKKALRATFGLNAWDCERPITMARQRLLERFDWQLVNATVQALQDQSFGFPDAHLARVLESVAFWRSAVLNTEIRSSDRYRAAERLCRLLNLPLRQVLKLSRSGTPTSD